MTTLLVIVALVTGFGLQVDAAGPQESGARPRSISTSRSETTWLDTDDRAAVVAGYSSEFDTPPPVLAWDGDHERCEGGASSPDHRRATLDRVNFYRAMAGVPAVITEDPSFTAKAQAAALMMSVEGTLTHHPTDAFHCFSVAGQQAAANSNLHLGRTGPAAIDGYIEDPGPKNTDVGHRNTVLHPPTRTMGIGDVAASADGHAANALWVFDDRVFNETSLAERPEVREPARFVAWPPRGFVPSELVFPRWSFTLAGADFSAADVTVYRPLASASQRRVPLAVVDRVGAEGHVPLPTIVWEPLVELDPEQDQDYLVVVTGVRFFDDGHGPSDGGHPLLATSTPSVSEPPTTYAYTVRIVGRSPSGLLSPEGFLVSIRRQSST